MTKDVERFHNLWNKDLNEDWSPEEFLFLKKQIRKKNYKVTYGFYNKKSAKNKQIALIIDLMPHMNRRTGAENNWEYIVSREITDLEIEEFINYYFRSSSQRFWVFYYKNIERLIEDDQVLKAITPNTFIKMCQERGYSGDYQTRIDFNSVS